MSFPSHRPFSSILFGLLLLLSAQFNSTWRTLYFWSGLFLFLSGLSDIFGIRPNIFIKKLWEKNIQAVIFPYIETKFKHLLALIPKAKTQVLNFILSRKANISQMRKKIITKLGYFYVILRKYVNEKRHQKIQEPNLSLPEESPAVFLQSWRTRLVLIFSLTILFLFYYFSLLRFLNAHNGITMFYVWEGIK